MAELGIYQDRFAESGRRVLEHAIEESRLHKQNYVSFGHILKALLGLNTAAFSDTLSALQIEPPLTGSFLDMVIEGSPSYKGAGIRLSPQVIWLLRHARRVARAEGREGIEASDLLQGLLRGLKAGAPWMGERQGRKIGFGIVPANQPHFFVIRL